MDSEVGSISAKNEGELPAEQYSRMERASYRHLLPCSQSLQGIPQSDIIFNQDASLRRSLTSLSTSRTSVSRYSPDAVGVLRRRQNNQVLPGLSTRTNRIQRWNKRELWKKSWEESLQLQPLVTVGSDSPTANCRNSVGLSQAEGSGRQKRSPRKSIPKITDVQISEDIPGMNEDTLSSPPSHRLGNTVKSFADTQRGKIWPTFQSLRTAPDVSSTSYNTEIDKRWKRTSRSVTFQDKLDFFSSEDRSATDKEFCLERARSTPNLPHLNCASPNSSIDPRKRAALFEKVMNDLYDFNSKKEEEKQQLWQDDSRLQQLDSGKESLLPANPDIHQKEIDAGTSCGTIQNSIVSQHDQGKVAALKISDNLDQNFMLSIPTPWTRLRIGTTASSSN
mmetsp:Transcript_1789/g.4214  ORF Transcript_1789/g.4214 Transcript_1789/m.4214 type:complete len:392 (+) Transcript_1789:277-1452(+)